MPTPTKYTYINLDFLNSKMNPDRLQLEIYASNISTALDRIDTNGGTYSLGVLSGTFTVDIWFKDVLSQADKITLDGDATDIGGLIAAHNNGISNPHSIVATPSQAGVIGDTDIISYRRGGYVGTTSTNFVTVRATAYIPQGTNSQRSINSTSTNDDVTGTGARTVRITYYNAACQGPFTEDISLDGTTAVNTVATNIALIERLEVITVGSSGGNEGTIRLWTATGGGGSVWASIAVGDNQTYWAHHYVASNKTCFITAMDACGKPTAGIVTLNKLDPTDVNIAQHNLDISYSYGNGNSPSFLKQFDTPLSVRGPAIIFINSRLDSGLLTSTTHAALGFFERLS